MDNDGKGQNKLRVSTGGTTTTTRRNRTLTTLIEDGLVDVNAQCHFIYEGKRYNCTITYVNNKYCFVGTRDNGDVITEHASTTFIRELLSLPSTFKIDGNKELVINNMRIVDYELKPLQQSGLEEGLKDMSINSNNNNETAQAKVVTPTKYMSSSTTSTTSTPGTPDNQQTNNGGLLRTPPSAMPPRRQALSQPTSVRPVYEFDLIKPSSTRHIQLEYQDMEPAVIKASGLGRYFHFNCERYLSWSTRSKSSSLSSSATTTSTTSTQSPTTTTTPTTIAEAIRLDGFVWENEVLDILKQAKHRVFLPGEKDGESIPYQEVIRILKEEKGDFYLFQSTLLVPKEFRGNLPTNITFSRSIPDFLSVTFHPTTGRRTIKILDAKSTSTIKFSQRLQLAYYYILLVEVFKLEGITDIDLDDNGAIYLKARPVPEDFDLVSTVEKLRRFMYGDSSDPESLLVKILKQRKMDSPWTLSEACEGCEYLPQCTKQAEAEGSRNVIAMHKHYTIETLLALKKDDAISTETKPLSEVERLCKIDPDIIKDLELKSEFIKMQPRLQAALTHSVELTGFNNVFFPIDEDVALYISLVSHPQKQTLFNWTLTVYDGLKSPATYTGPGEKIADMVSLMASLFTENSAKRTLQVFIWDTFERGYFFSLCRELLTANQPDSPIFQSVVQVLAVLYDDSDWINFNLGYYPHEPFSYNSKNGKEGSGAKSTPFVVIKEQVMQALAINIYPPYTLADIACSMLGLKTAPTSLLPDHIFATIIQPGLPDCAPFIERVDYLHQVITNLRVRLFTAQSHEQKIKKFKQRSALKYVNPLINKLMYCYQFELMAKYRMIRSVRSCSVDINIHDGKYLIMTLMDDGRFQTRIHQQYYSYFEQRLKDTFAHFAMVHYSHDGVKLLRQYDDLDFMAPTGIYEVTKILVSPADTFDSFVIANITLALPKDVVLEKRQSYILFEKFDTDYFSQYKWLVASYEQIDSQANSPMLDLFNNPAKWTSESEEYADFARAVKHTIEALNQTDTTKRMDNRLTLTPSQRQVVENASKKRLQLVRGPPGTGKTHFLALLVLIIFDTWIRLERKEGYLIVITALTHTAIDNALLRIAKLKKEYETYTGASLHFHIVKKEKTISQALASNGVLTVDQAAKNLYRFQVVGATCWGVSTLKTSRPIDYLIIDEASQLQTPIAAMAMNLAHRYLICGDNLQLPPVLQGKYAVKHELAINNQTYDPKVHKSVFSCVKSLLIKNNCGQAFLTLNENFRMTPDLCQFAAKYLYGDSYRCFDVDQKPTIEPALLGTYSEVIRSIYDSGRSCFTLMIDGNHFGNRQVEVDLVRQIYMYERERFIRRNQQKQTWHSADDLENAFWSSLQLGVVTPLNAQRIDMQLMVISEQAKHGCAADHKPSIGTAEKMQGQEFDTVVVCYNGWSSSNKAHDFIYNLNRLNVSFTRSKQRVILITSRPLLAPSQAVLSNKKTERAYDYLMNFVNYSNVTNLVAHPVTSGSSSSGITPLKTSTTGTPNLSTPDSKELLPIASTPQTPIQDLQLDFISKLSLTRRDTQSNDDNNNNQ
ncbi:hypothetical protein SAMD00019534_079170 [Acytostelium subglobosum LB1]|uniref:hypothetical protein n=1 Tax=Acytostelium subglobosum LB1 TaxID=1410327 RepID=UPI000644CB3C|nr:hypothetical protein SAMD00019534_079170 [Acytostelium subglobosum LB1]GAM24742.1 hypothetical protein SAMD00019534_079170 [Acytostelium subglobosum LB1]|eukprot:XP_012752411.1 hypothetical protein SAMD00019534_079170 [Acytostelium subglobosum LB1]